MVSTQCLETLLLPTLPPPRWGDLETQVQGGVGEEGEGVDEDERGYGFQYSRGYEEQGTDGGVV